MALYGLGESIDLDSLKLEAEALQIRGGSLLQDTGTGCKGVVLGYQEASLDHVTCGTLAGFERIREATTPSDLPCYREQVRGTFCPQKRRRPDTCMRQLHAGWDAPRHRNRPPSRLVPH